MAMDGPVPAGRRARAADPVAPVIPLVYEAALAPSGWPVLLAALARALGGSAADLRTGVAGGAPGITASHGIGPGAIRSYDAIWGALDPVTPAAGAGAAWRAPATARQAAGEALERTDSSPAGCARTAWMTISASACCPRRRRIARCSASPGRHAARGFSTARSTILARLAPHLRRAMQVHRSRCPSGAWPACRRPGSPGAGRGAA